MYQIIQNFYEETEENGVKRRRLVRVEYLGGAVQYQDLALRHVSKLNETNTNPLTDYDYLDLQSDRTQMNEDERG
jgi:hypothetical protein